VAADTPLRPESTLSPSDFGGEKALPGEGAGLSEAAAKARGTRVHRLLETLPGRPKVQWPDIAQALADAEATDADTAEALAEARRALDSPALAFVFAGDTLAEVDITASLPALDGARIHGSIDRLVLRPESVLAVDFKTNAAVPDDPDTVPDGLLRQMGAYAAALKQVFPDRKVETAILWTRTAQLMYLPDDMVSAALVTAGAP
jgi:ATP-dependent helicase/nuclease subunit A